MDVEILENGFVNRGNGFTICAHSFCPLLIDQAHSLQIHSYVMSLSKPSVPACDQQCKFYNKMCCD